MTVCLYGRQLARLVVLCDGLFQVIYIKMPSSFCAVGCTNPWSKVGSVTFYRIPLGDGSAEELDRETGEEQITVGWKRRKDGG